MAFPVNVSGPEDPDGIPEEALDRFVATHPELQKLYLRQNTIRTVSRYRPFYQTAKLTPPQITGFEKAMAGYEQALIDITTAAVEQGLDKHSPQLQQLRDAARDERNRALRDVLGSDHFAAFSEYQKTRTMRDVSTYVAGELFYTQLR